MNLGRNDTIYLYWSISKYVCIINVAFFKYNCHAFNNNFTLDLNFSNVFFGYLCSGELQMSGWSRINCFVFYCLLSLKQGIKMIYSWVHTWVIISQDEFQTWNSMFVSWQEFSFWVHSKWCSRVSKKSIFLKQGIIWLDKFYILASTSISKCIWKVQIQLFCVGSIGGNKKVLTSDK